MPSIHRYTRAQSIEEALFLLQRGGERARLLAGGTDLLPMIRSGRVAGVELIDVSDVSELQGIACDGPWLRVGAATRLADIARAPLLDGGLRVLADAAAQVGSTQIRHLATLGGNVCNASPSADTAPALLVLDAVAIIKSQTGERHVPLKSFFVGPGRTVLEPGELLTAVLLPSQWREGSTCYIKHSPRGAMDLAIAGVAAAYRVTADGSRLVRIGLGAVAPTPIRAHRSEEQLLAAPEQDERTVRDASASAADEAKPISDVRASAPYRREMVAVMVERALSRVLPHPASLNDAG